MGNSTHTQYDQEIIQVYSTSVVSGQAVPVAVFIYDSRNFMLFDSP